MSIRGINRSYLCRQLREAFGGWEIGSLLKRERQRKISEFIEEKKSATVAELSRLFGVSQATIRRDLEKLDSQGAIERAHGGAILAERAAPEPPVIHRMAEQLEEKRRIGEAAAKLVEDGDTIFIGSGTTTLEMARHLSGKRNLTVITNALNVANCLADHPEITVVITGGLLRHSELSMIGHLTDQALSNVRADKVFIGMRAVSLQDGLTSEHLPEITTDQAIIEFAAQVILLVDHSKFGKVSTALVAPATSVDKIVTDSAVSEELIEELGALGIGVLVA